MGGLRLDQNAQWVLAGCMLLGLSSGVLGSFALLRRRSLMGDALAHAALPGVCIAFLLTGTRTLGVLLVGAAFAGLFGAWCIDAVSRHSRVKEDAALGLVLSVFFGVGVVLLTLIQHSDRGSQAGLDKFIFGQAASLVGSDVRTMALSAGVVCCLSALLFKEFKLLCFDPGFARGLGFDTAVLDGVLMLLIVLAVVVGLQAVGVVLMAAMLITPAAAARFWTDRLTSMVWIAGVMGAAAGALGTLLSAAAPGMPTGPLIVLSATSLFIFSLLFAPRRGLVGKALHLVRMRARVSRENALRALYEIAEAEQAWDVSLTPERLRTHRGGIHALHCLPRLEREGLVVSGPGGSRLTERGLHLAYETVRNHRLWEMFLMHEGHFGADHVDRDADLIEHHLSADSVRELERLLQVHGRELELPRSVHPI